MSTFQFFTSDFDSKLTVAVSEKYLQMMEKKPLIFFGRTLIQQFKNIKIKTLNHFLKSRRLSSKTQIIEKSPIKYLF